MEGMLIYSLLQWSADFANWYFQSSGEAAPCQIFIVLCYFACLTFVSYEQLLEHWKLRITCNLGGKPCDSCGQGVMLITVRMGLAMFLLRCTMCFIVIFRNWLWWCIQLSQFPAAASFVIEFEWIHRSRKASRKVSGIWEYIVLQSGHSWRWIYQRIWFHSVWNRGIC